MPLSQANIEWISQVSGVSVDEISGALSSEEEVSLDLRLNGKVISQKEEQSIREGGIQQGKEIGYKEIAKGLNITLESGEKDPIVIAEKFNSSLSSTLEEKYKNRQPTDELEETMKKSQEWERKYNTLNGTYEEAKSSIQDLENKYTGLQGEIKQKEINNTILKSFPEKMKMDRSDALLITKNAFEFDLTDSGIVVKKGGEVVQDPLGNPEKLENVLSAYVEEKKWIKQSGMNGGDRSVNTSGKGLSAEEAEKAIIKSGIDPGSPEGLKAFNEMTK